MADMESLLIVGGLGTGESTNCGGGGRDSLLIVGVADGIVN